MEQLSYRFPARLKLRSAIDYKQTFQGTIKLVAGNIKLFAKPNSLNHPRLGLAISRKKTSSAVLRNRLKRITRESFRLHQDELKPVDIVIIVLRKMDDIDNKKLQAWLNSLWQRLSKA